MEWEKLRWLFVPDKLAGIWWGKTVEAVQEIGVQVNGKVRATVKIAIDAAKEDALAAGREAIADKLAGKQIVKEIYVPGRILNFVVK